MVSYARCGRGGPPGASCLTTASSARLSHAQWDGTSPVVVLPQGRTKALSGKLRSVRGPGWRALAGQRGSTRWAGQMVQDQVHRLLRSPPQYAVAEGMGSRQGTSAIAVARQGGGRQRNCQGERCWARGSAVSTGGVEAAQRRASPKPQEQLDAHGADESGAFSARDRGPWQPCGLLTPVKPPALRGRYD
jgi:REP-associated tyrosine transposase